MEHAILHETIDGEQVNFYPETGFDDVLETDGDDETTLRMVLEGIDSAISLLQSSVALKANTADVTDALAGKADIATTLAGYGITDAYTKTEVDTDLNGKLSLTGGTMTGGINYDAVVIAARTTDDSRMQINGATSYSNGAYLLLNGKDYDGNTGGVTICANDGTNSPQLELYADGTAYWGGNGLDTIVFSGTNYIRYDNGIQICWLFSTSFAVASSGETQVTYPQAFVASPAVAMVGGFGTDWVSGKTYSATGFLAVIYNQSGTKYTSGTRTLGYIAVGRWK